VSTSSDALSGKNTDLSIVGERSVDLLTRQLGFNLLSKGTTFQRPGIRFESYPGLGHSSSPKEIEDMKSWLTEALK
jgi:lysophospholipase-2